MDTRENFQILDRAGRWDRKDRIAGNGGGGGGGGGGERGLELQGTWKTQKHSTLFNRADVLKKLLLQKLLKCYTLAYYKFKKCEGKFMS